MRRPGKIQPARAAEILGVHRNSVYAWCKLAVDGTPTKLARVERSVTGYYWIDSKEIEALKKKA